MKKQNPGYYRKAQKIHLLSLIVGIGFIVAVAFHVVAHNFGWRFPYNTYFTHPTDRFGDLLNNIQPFSEMGFSVSLFPSVDLVYWALFAYEPSWGIWIMISCFGVFFLGLMSRFLWTSDFSWMKNLSYILVLSVCGYPAQFAIERGNIECILFIAVALFILLFQRKKFMAASAALAFAIEMKLFPAIFVTTYIKSKRFRELAWLGLFLVLIATCLLIAPDFQKTLDHYAWFVDLYTREYIIGDSGLAYGHSAFAFFKTTLYLIEGLIPNFDAHQWLKGNTGSVLRLYTFLSLAIYFFVALRIYFAKTMPYWRQISILVVLLCFLPNVSADYKLLHLYVPLLLFVNAPPTLYDRSITWLFGLSLVPKNYFSFENLIEGGCSTLVQPVILATMLWIFLKDESCYTPLPVPFGPSPAQVTERLD